MVVTSKNVTKISEDGLYIALDALTMKDPLYLIIEAELDRRLEVQKNSLKRRHKAQLESLKLTQQMQEEISSLIGGSFIGTLTGVLIENFGQEFLEDYSVCEETFTVSSKVRHEIFSNPSTWEFDNIESARRKVAKLVYDRIYNKFMRDATPENLELLKRVLYKG